MPEVYKDVDSFHRSLAKTPNNYYFNNDGLMSTNMYANNSPYSSADSQYAGSMASPISGGYPPAENDMEYLLHENDILTLSGKNMEEMGNPEIRILDQPIEKFRFRYRSEMMGTHGSLTSVSSINRKKRQAPTVKLVNFIGKQAMIRCTLVTKNEDRRVPHAHHLITKEENSESDAPYEIEVSEKNNWTASYQGMGIIHTAKKHIKEEIMNKMRIESLEEHRRKNPSATSLPMREESRIKMEAEQVQKWMDLNSIALCFRAYVPNEYGIMSPITEPVYSHTINNLKSALTGELKICRIDKYTSSCSGGEEVFLLVEKVGKKNIKVKFFEVDDQDNEIWCDYGKFSELDVHHQYAIVCQTPSYKDRYITSPKEVWMQLERPTDGDCSEPVRFTYKPSDSLLHRKRPRMSYSENVDLTNPIPTDITMSNHAFANDLIGDLTPSDVSAEIKKLVLADQNSTELQRCIENMGDDFMSDYFHLARNDNFESSLCIDGKPISSPSSLLESTDFAPNVLMEAVQRIKNSSTSIKEVMEMLNERTAWGDTPLHSAIRYNQTVIVEKFLSIIASASQLNCLVDMKNKNGQTPLHYAVSMNQPEIVKKLLILGADPNARDERGTSVLHEAAKTKNSSECVNALLKAKAIIEDQDDLGRNALQLAADIGSLDTLNVLVKAGADVNSSERTCGKTALHLAVEKGHIEVVRYLLEMTKVQVNKQNFCGNTALHTAVVNKPGARALEIIHLLKKCGADPRIANCHKKTRDHDDDNDEDVTIKQEESNDKKVMTEGQTAFDLALEQERSTEILNVLEKNDNSQRNNLDLLIATKPGLSVLEKKNSIDSCNISEWLDVYETTGLAKILDTNNGWKILAKKIDCEYLTITLQDSDESPALAVLSYADIQGINLHEMFQLLVELKQTEAANFMEQVIKTRSNSTV